MAGNRHEFHLQRPKPYPPSGDQPVFAEPYLPPGAASSPPKSKTGWGCLGCALGCLGFTVVLVIIAGAGAWYAYTKIPDMARKLVAQGVEESELDPEDKQKVMQQVDRLVEGYKKGKISWPQLGKFGRGFHEVAADEYLVAFARAKAVHREIRSVSGGKNGGRTDFATRRTWSHPKRKSRKRNWRRHRITSPTQDPMARENSKRP